MANTSFFSILKSEVTEINRVMARYDRRCTKTGKEHKQIYTIVMSKLKHHGYRLGQLLPFTSLNTL